VSIELSKTQVDHVMRAAAGGASFSAVLHGGLETQELPDRLDVFDDSRLSQALLAGLLTFASFPGDGEYLGNGEIARRLRMNPSTTHRYITTLVEVGLLERHPSTRRYRIVQLNGSGTRPAS
jgi:DNA-binding MarR family transcriptional regulator